MFVVLLSMRGLSSRELSSKCVGSEMEEKGECDMEVFGKKKRVRYGLWGL